MKLKSLIENALWKRVKLLDMLLLLIKNGERLLAFRLLFKVRLLMEIFSYISLRWNANNFLNLMFAHSLNYISITKLTNPPYSVTSKTNPTRISQPSSSSKYHSLHKDSTNLDTTQNLRKIIKIQMTSQ